MNKSETFDWSRVRWSGPQAQPTDRCSYCSILFREEDFPLRLWKRDGSGAALCDSCIDFVVSSRKAMLPLKEKK